MNRPGYAVYVEADGSAKIKIILADGQTMETMLPETTPAEDLIPYTQAIKRRCHLLRSMGGISSFIARWILRDSLSRSPAAFPHGSGGISPVAAYTSAQPGADRQGCISTAVLRRLALDRRPRLCYFPAARRGYVLQSRPLSHDWERAGGLG